LVEVKSLKVYESSGSLLGVINENIHPVSAENIIIRGDFGGKWHFKTISAGSRVIKTKLSS
jgi:hypothetical protein